VVPPKPLRLISWNVNGRYGPALLRQVEAVGERNPDILALQEVRLESLGAWQTGLHKLGLTYLVESSHLLQRPAPQGQDYKRRYFNLIASRWPLADLDDLEVAFPERYVAAAVQRPGQALEVHNAHIPPGSTRGLIKVEMFEAIYERLAHAAPLPRILCGDFNTPRSEGHDGTVTFWGSEHPQHLTRWDAAEASVILDLSEHGLPDLFRQLHGYETQEASYVLRRRDTHYHRRYDHIFASPALGGTSCRYHHDWRDPHRLSDHSALEAEFSEASTVRTSAQAEHPD
jgi:exonuclease III